MPSPKMILALFAIVVAVLVSSSAEACNRAGCGLFGNRCRFQHHARVVHHPHVAHVAHAAYQQPSVIIQNSIYPNQLAATGTTDYGLSLQSYQQNPQLEIAANVSGLLRLSQSVVDGGNNLALRVTDTVRETSAAALAVQQASGAQIAEVAKLVQLAEIAKATKSERVVQSIQIEANGQVSVDQGGGQLAGAILAGTCAKCHSGASPQGGFAIDVDWSDEKRLKALEEVRAGRMPMKDGKPAPLDPAAKWSFFEELYPVQ